MDTNTHKIVSRFAPSPTMKDGSKPHLGFFRALYLAWLAARGTKDGGKFILRIDDTDLERSTEENIQEIVKNIEWVGLDYDVMFKQSNRFSRYRDMATILIKQGLAHRDTDENGRVCVRLSELPIREIDNHLPLGSWQERVNKKPRIIKDKTLPEDKKSFCFNQVILKSDGSPTYNFCTVIDDLDYNITDIVRGTDHIDNTYKQSVIYDLLDREKPRFHHVGLVCNENSKKLSKRESNNLNIEQYRPEALLNYVLRHGWAPYKDDKNATFIDTNRARQMFWGEGRMKPSNSNINITKLQFLNNYYGRKE